MADSGGDGIEHVECEQHHPAFKLPTQVSLLGNILAGAKEIERLTSTDELPAHIANQTVTSGEFLTRNSPYEQGRIAPILIRSIPVQFVASGLELFARDSRRQYVGSGSTILSSSRLSGERTSAPAR